MPGKMRARHEVFGVKDVPKTDHYLNNGWVEVDPSTPTTEQERRRAINEGRRWAPAASDHNEHVHIPFDPAEHNVDEVVSYLEAVSDEERERVLEAERSGKARRTILDD